MAAEVAGAVRTPEGTLLTAEPKCSASIPGSQVFCEPLFLYPGDCPPPRISEQHINPVRRWLGAARQSRSSPDGMATGPALPYSSQKFLSVLAHLPDESLIPGIFVGGCP